MAKITETFDASSHLSGAVSPKVEFELLVDSSWRESLSLVDSAAFVPVTEVASTLSQGDIAIVQYSSDDNPAGETVGDGFTFVLLADVGSGTEIHFTDSSFNAAGQITVAENTWTWTADADYAAGTAVRIYDSIDADSSNSLQTASAGSVVTTGPTGDLSSSGDQIFIYQGAVAGLGDSPSLLFGIGFNDNTGANPHLTNGWNTNASTDANESQLPASLAGFELAFTPEVDNGYYNPAALHVGTASEIFAAIIDESNWIVDADYQGDPPPSAPFGIGSPPVVTTNNVSSIAEGGTDLVTTSELETTDADTPATDLEYTLDSGVANGTLFLDANTNGLFDSGETVLISSSTFTQDDIDQGRLVYIHDGSETTTDSFQFDVSDGVSSVDDQLFQFNIFPIDDPAVAVDDAFTVTETEVFSSGNLFAANPTTADLDPDDPLSVTAVNGAAVNVGTQIALASGALLTVNMDGTFTYDTNGAFEILPDFAASGADNTTDTDSFTYQLNGESTATVTVTITGEDSDRDWLFGTSGDDMLFGGIGRDNFLAGDGDDALTGGAGNDWMNGQDGNDVIYGGEGSDYLDGRVGLDTLYAGDGNDTLFGRGDDDMLYGGTGIDTLYGGSGFDYLEGGNNADVLYGGVLADELYGGGGRDELYGDNGQDQLFGGDGNDLLDGGLGADTLTGGFGADVFVFTDDVRNNTITDFQTGVDTIDLSGHSFFTDFATVQANAAQVGADVVISGVGDDAITIETFLLANLTADDFSFGIGVV